MQAQTGEALEFIGEATEVSATDANTLHTGMNTTVYGPFVEAMVQHGAESIRRSQLEPESVISALGVAAKLYGRADSVYSAQQEPLRGDPLRQHQQNVLNGDIAFVAPEAAVSEANSVAQVVTADTALSWQASRTEAALAALNYGTFFRPQTMANATRTLDRSEIDELLEKVRTNPEAMPHLTVSNWAIGQTAAGIYRAAALAEQPMRVRIVDIGSGQGSTMAATASCLLDVDDIYRRPDLAVTATEPTPAFFDELETFARTDDGIARLGLEVVTSDKAMTELSEFGALTLVKGDAVEILHGIDPMRWSRPDEVTIVTANYSWHRLNMDKKASIMEKFADISLNSNVVFIVGDLAQNTSVINRRYFNLAANGPLNAGNRNLNNHFLNTDHMVVDLAGEVPAALDYRLDRQIGKDHEQNDGHLWIAYSGQKARELLGLVYRG